MAENDPQPQPPQVPNTPEPPTQDMPPPQPKRRKRRKWPYLLGGFLLLLILLVVFAPTLASTGPVRNMILGIVNKNLNGKMEVADWSISWTRGATVKGLKIRDDKGDVVLQVSDVRTQLSLLNTLRSGFSQFHLGKTEVENLDLTKFHVDENGIPNYAKLAKDTGPDTDPSKKVEVSGDIHVKGMTGTLTAANVPQTIRIQPSTIDVDLAGLDQPIKHDMKLVFAVDNSRPGTLSTAGEIDLLDNGEIDPKKAKMAQTVRLTGVDLAIANPLLAMAKNTLKLGGIADGTLNIGLNGLDNLTAAGDLKIAKFQASGGPLKGDDVFRSDLHVPVKITRAVENGVEILKIEDMRLATDYGTVTVKANTSQDALHNLRSNQPPGREGNFHVTVDFKDAGKLVTSLRNTLKLAPGTEVNSGKVWAQLDAAIQKDRVVARTQLSLDEVAGVRKDPRTGQAQRIALSPIKQSFDGTYVPTGDRATGFSTDQLRGIALTFTSAFLTLNGGTGPEGTLAKFNLKGDGDLAKLQQELGQFIDMGDLKLAGTFGVAANTDGDPTKPDAAVKTNIGVTVNNLVVAGLAGKPPINQPWLNLTADGNLHLKDNSPTTLTGAVVTLRSNNPNQPTVDLLARGDFDLQRLTAEQFNLERLRIDLTKARSEGFVAFFPVLDNFSSGVVTATGAGKYDGKTFVFSAQNPLKVVGQNLSVQLPKSDDRPRPVDVLKNRTLELTLAGALQRLDKVTSLKAESFILRSPELLEIKTTGGPLAVTYQSDPRKIQGNGTLSVFADVKQVNDILKSMQPAPTDGESPPQPIAQLTRGLLNGTLQLARADQPTTSVKGDFTIDVAMTTHKEPLADKIAVTLGATVPDDLTQEARANLDVKGTYATVNVADVVAVAAHKAADQTYVFNDPLNLLRKATLTVRAPRLDAVQAILDGLLPLAAPAPAAPPAVLASARENPAARRPQVSDDEVISAEKPLPPLRVESGSLVMNASLDRQGDVTHLKDSSVTIENLRLWRGDGSYDASGQKINLNVAADIETANQRIRRIRFSRLDGNLNFATLAMPKTIEITNPAAVENNQVAATGAIELKGSLDKTLRLLEALAGAKPFSKYPYAGDYVLTQEVTTQDQRIRLAGKLDATDFRAFDPQNPRKETFREDLLAVVNDVAADLATDTLTINNVSIDARSSGALKLTLTDGKLVDWDDQRKIPETLTATVKADWGKLWNLVRPMLSPETLETLGEDFKLEGPMERKFTVSGAFPATGTNRRGKVVPLPFQASIKRLHATGGLFVPHLYWKGLDARDADVPIILYEGIALVRDASKPKGDRIPAPIKVNSGMADIGDFRIDLTWINPKDPTSITPLLTIPERNHVVVKGVQINPVLAEFLGENVSTLFSGSKDASGTVDLVAVHCDRLPLGSAMKQPDAPGSAQFEFAMSKVQLQGDGIGRITGAIALAFNQIGRAAFKSSGNNFEGFDSITGAITKSTITIERGKIGHRLNLETDRFGPWTFDGNLDLATKSFARLNVQVPTSMFGRNNDLARFLGDRVTFPFAGPIHRPTIAPNFINKLIEENVVKGLPNLLEGAIRGRDRDGANRDRDRQPQGDDPIPNRPDGDRNRQDNPNTARERDGRSRPEDLLGGLLDEFGGGVLGQDEEARDARTAGQRRSAPGAGTRDDRDMGDQRISGDERISGNPDQAPPDQRSTPRPRGNNAVSGDERISGNPARPATQPTTRRARGRNR